MTAGIGCSAWIAVYMHADVLKVLHGRAIPAAIGLKATRPSRKVVTFTGDGDCLAIGGNHLLHACRRNIDMTVVMVNNQIYAMTGGQVAPSTPFRAKTQTTPYGNIEKKLDGCKVAIAAGATHGQPLVHGPSQAAAQGPQERRSTTRVFPTSRSSPSARSRRAGTCWVPVPPNSISSGSRTTA